MIALLMSSLAFAGTTTKLDAGLFAGPGELKPVASWYKKESIDEGACWDFKFLMATPTWGQGYLGLGCAPTNWFEFELGAGLEIFPDVPGRVGGDVWFGKGPLSLIVFGEYGGSGPWYKAIAKDMVTDWLAIGAMSEYVHGTGPRVEVKHKKVTFYGAALWKTTLVPTANAGATREW